MPEDFFHAGSSGSDIAPGLDIIPGASPTGMSADRAADWVEATPTRGTFLVVVGVLAIMAVL